jgi:hypothetical protein
MISMVTDVPIWRARRRSPGDVRCARSVRGPRALIGGSVTSAACGLEEFDHVPRVMRHLAGARHRRDDDRDRPEVLVRLAEARERACVLALVRALPAFLVARDLERFVVVVAPRVFFFVLVRFGGRFFVEGDGDLGAD